MENKSKAIPDDMQIEILLRMPVKSLMKCICVSKRWASIIRGKQFRDLYLLRSMTRPQMLFVVYPMVYERHDALFHSVLQQEKPLLESSINRRFFSREAKYEVSQPIRGLVCLQAETKVAICNPSTRKIVALPEIQAPREANIATFFGYDEATNVFKVLCVTDLEGGLTSEGAREHQVLTVGSGEESWRPITCEYPHSPVTKGLCKGGILYYGALYAGNSYVVMSFNVRTEEFSGTELPDGVELGVRWKLVNYKGKIAIVNDPLKDMRDNGTLRFWVMDENDEGVWWGIQMVIPCWRETVGDMLVSFKGTTRTGELVFAPNILIRNPLLVMYYNTVTRRLRTSMIDHVLGCPYGYVLTYLDHVDSLLLM